MLKLDELTAGSEQMTLEWRGHPFTVDYNLARYTPKLERERAEALKTGDDASAGLALILARVVTGIDISLDGKKPMAPTIENFEALPFPLLTELVNAIHAKLYPQPPTPEKRTGSFGSS